MVMTKPSILALFVGIFLAGMMSGCNTKIDERYPNAPEGLSVTGAAGRIAETGEELVDPYITCSKESASGIVGLKLYRSDDSQNGTYKLIPNSEEEWFNGSPVARDRTTDRNHTYYYKVSSFTNEGKESPLSSETITFRFLDVLEQIQPAEDAVVQADSPFTLSWDSSQELDSYVVVIQKDMEWHWQEKTSSTSCIVEGLKPGNYRWWIQGLKYASQRDCTATVSKWRYFTVR